MLLDLGIDVEVLEDYLKVAEKSISSLMEAHIPKDAEDKDDFPVKLCGKPYTLRMVRSCSAALLTLVQTLPDKGVDLSALNIAIKATMQTVKGLSEAKGSATADNDTVLKRIDDLEASLPELFIEANRSIRRADLKKAHDVTAARVDSVPVERIAECYYKAGFRISDAMIKGLGISRGTICKKLKEAGLWRSPDKVTAFLRDKGIAY